MRLSDLFSECTFPSEYADLNVCDITNDSRKVKKGSVFFATQGSNVDGTVYIDQAFNAGAIAVVREKIDAIDSASNDDFYCIDQQQKITIYIKNLNQNLGSIAAHYFDSPSEKVCLVGITGTNGKTSCVNILVQLWRSHSLCAASIGTLGWSSKDGELNPTGLTTLDAIENQRLLALLVQKNVTHVAMEVSSHGIDQGRIYGLEFDVKMITNIVVIFSG